MRHQDNHLALGRKIRDPIATISSDGVKASALLRNDYLNKANLLIQEQLWLSNDERKIAKYLSGLIKTQTFTFDSGGAVQATDISYPVNCKLDGITQLSYVDAVMKFTLDTNILYERNVFLIDGGKIYGYRGRIISSGAGTLEYIQNDKQTLTDADLAINNIWDSQIVEIAATYFWQDAGTMTANDADIARKRAIGTVVQ